MQEVEVLPEQLIDYIVGIEIHRRTAVWPSGCDPQKAIASTATTSLNRREQRWPVKGHEDRLIRYQWVVAVVLAVTYFVLLGNAVGWEV